jgi:hypothetical protein
VTINGDVNLSAINAVTRIGPGTSFATARMANTSTEIGFLAGATMTGTILLEGAATGTRFIGMSAPGAVTIGATSVIRSETGLGGNTQIGVGNNFFSAMALTNQGLISSQVSGRTITINAASLANTGTGKLAASNGGILTIAPTGAWTNSGTIELSTGGIVNLSGTFDATGGIGTFSNTGGTVNITGTINAGSGANTLTLNNSTGSWTLAGGTISGGALSFAGGASLLINANPNNLLTGVTINGDVNLSALNAVTRIGPGTNFTTAHLANQSTEIGFLAGATMNSTILMEGAATGTRFIGMSAPGAVTIGAPGVIRSETGLGANAQIGIGNHFFSAMALTNAGLISSQVSGRTITINAASLANTGTGKLAASNGGILTIAPTVAWTNGGTIELSTAGIVNLSGTFDATGGIGTFNNTGGTVNITGTINAGSGANTLTLNNATGSWTLAGGIISGGALSFAGGASLLISTGTNNLLTGVTINGDVNLSALNAVTRIGPGTTFTTAHLANQSTEIGFLAGATMNGTILLEGAATGTRFIGMSAVGAVTIGAPGVIRSETGLGGNAQIGIGNNFFSAMALTNAGLISSQVSGRTITINASSLTNTGGLEAINGGILAISPAAAWTNAGSISVGATPSIVNLSGTFDVTGGIGTWSNAGGTVNINGTINNTGSTTTLNNRTGSWTLNGGTFSGGTLAFADGKTLLFSNTSNNSIISGVTVNGDLTFNVSNARARIEGGSTFATAHLSESNTELGFAPGSTLTGTILFEGAAGGTRFVSMNGTAGMLTIGAAGVLRAETGVGGNAFIGGGNSYAGAMTLVNGGTISSQVSGRSITINSASMSNTGTLSATNGGTLLIPRGYIQTAGVTRLGGGTLTAQTGIINDTLQLNAGMLEGFGSIVANVSLSGVIDPTVGAASGLAINGDLMFGTNVELRFAVGGTAKGTEYDFLSEAGTVPLTLDGTLKLSLANGFTPAFSDTFTILTSNANLVGTFDNIVSGARLATSDGLSTFVVTYGGQSVVLSAFLVPEPGAGVLIAIGAGIHLVRRRARACRSAA